MQTSIRSMLDKHHIIPRGAPGCTNLPKNIFWVCPSHHRMIHIPGVSKGIHSMVHPDSIVIHSRLQSTHGKVLEYLKCSEGKAYFYFYKDRETWEK